MIPSEGGGGREGSAPRVEGAEGIPSEGGGAEGDPLRGWRGISGGARGGSPPRVEGNHRRGIPSAISGDRQ